MGFCTLISCFLYLDFYLLYSRTSHELWIFLFRDLLFVQFFVHCFKVSFQISAPDHPGGIEPLTPWPCPETLPRSYGSLPRKELGNLGHAKKNSLRFTKQVVRNAQINDKIMQKVVAVAEWAAHFLHAFFI